MLSGKTAKMADADCRDQVCVRTGTPVSYTHLFLDNFGNDDWYGGFSDFVSGCEWYLQHVAEGGEAGVPVHNEDVYKRQAQ